MKLEHGSPAGAKPSGLFGLQSPGYFSGVGARYMPEHMLRDNTSSLSTGSGVLYYTPIFFREMRQFTGLATYNNGAGDNGEVYRVGVYRAALNASGLRGLPSTLLQDCGEITLTGASAQRLAATSFTPDYVGWHWLAYHANSAADMMAMNVNSSGSTAVGQIGALPQMHLFGLSALNYGVSSQMFGALTVSTAYAALASTAVAPTAIVQSVPIIAPYIT